MLAAFLGPTLPFERYYDPSYPRGHYIEDRRYVAWLCEECAIDAALVRWFANRVDRYYPWATIVQSPGAPDETPFISSPAEPVGHISADRAAWGSLAINGTISKGPPPIAAPREETE